MKKWKRRIVRGFNERCIVIPMKYGVPPFYWRKRVPGGPEEQELLSLRKELLKWRLVNRDVPLPQEIMIGATGRNEELWRAIVQTVHDMPDVEKRLLKHVRSQTVKKQNIRKACKTF